MIPRQFFPNVPDEVFDMWLIPLAKDYGWPFENIHEETKDTKWYHTLGGLPLSFWHSAEWELTQRDLLSMPFSFITKFVLRSLIEQYQSGSHTVVANLERTKERFGACADFIITNGIIPKPIIVLERNGAFEIVDGNHRVAALLHVGVPQNYKVPMWIPKQIK